MQECTISFDLPLILIDPRVAYGTRTVCSSCWYQWCPYQSTKTKSHQYNEMNSTQCHQNRVVFISSLPPNLPHEDWKTRSWPSSSRAHTQCLQHPPPKSLHFVSFQTTQVQTLSTDSRIVHLPLPWFPQERSRCCWCCHNEFLSLQTKKKKRK